MGLVLEHGDSVTLDVRSRTCSSSEKSPLDELMKKTFVGVKDGCSSTASVCVFSAIVADMVVRLGGRSCAVVGCGDVHSLRCAATGAIVWRQL